MTKINLEWVNVCNLLVVDAENQKACMSEDDNSYVLQFRTNDRDAKGSRALSPAAIAVIGEEMPKPSLP
jgi:hypothetical protein